jgi:hypothetical protein
VFHSDEPPVLHHGKWVMRVDRTACGAQVLLPFSPVGQNVMQTARWCSRCQVSVEDPDFRCTHCGRSVASQADSLLPAVLLERFEILRVLGRGGMGVVYLVRDRRLLREVALKMLPVYRPDHARSLEQEALHLAALDSDHVVRVHDAGVAEGMPYLRPGAVSTGRTPDGG